MNYSLDQINPENIKYAVTIILKIVSFLKKTLGTKQAKRRLSLVYQECLKPNPNKKFITKTLSEFEGVKKFQSDVDEIKEFSKLFGPGPKGFGFVEMSCKGKKVRRFALGKIISCTKRKQPLNKNIFVFPSHKKAAKKRPQRPKGK